MPKLSGFPPAHIPGPAPVPVLGSLPGIIKFFRDPVETVMRLRSLGDVVAVVRNNPALVCAFGFELNREVLGNAGVFRHDEDFIQAREGSPLSRFSKTMISMNGDAVMRRRRLVTPAFTKQALDGYGDEIVKVAEGMVARWPVGQVTNLDALLRDLALCAAVRCLFGLDVLAGATEIGDATTSLLATLTSPLTILLPHDVPGTPHRRAQQIAGRLLGHVEKLIEEKRRGAPGSDALALLVHATDVDEEIGFTNDELVAETVNLLVAGYETTAKALSWTMFLLERHPTVLGEVFEEIDAVLGGRSIALDDLPRMPSMDRVIKESMRLFPPLSVLFTRVPAADCQLGGIDVPKGANVVISPYITHREPGFYTAPQRFLPERWERLTPTHYEYMPFGAGPRMCIGAVFAQQALRLILPTVLQRVRFTLVPNAKIDRMAHLNILMLRHGLPVELQAPHRRRLPLGPVRGNVHQMVELR
jgi:cytochrome P450